MMKIRWIILITVVLFSGHPLYMGCYMFDGSFIHNVSMPTDIMHTHNDPIEDCREHCKWQELTWAGKYVCYIFSDIFILNNKLIVCISPISSAWL